MRPRSGRAQGAVGLGKGSSESTARQHRCALGKISFVDLGADGNTTATIAAQQENELMDETQDTEVLPTDAQDTPQEVAHEGGAEGAGTDAGPPATPIADIRAQALAETKRIAAIRTICAGKCPEIEAQAIAEGWSRDKTELAVLRAS